MARNPLIGTTPRAPASGPTPMRGVVSPGAPLPTRNQARMQGIQDIQQARNQFYQHREANKDERQQDIRAGRVARFNRRQSNRASR